MIETFVRRTVKALLRIVADVPPLGTVRRKIRRVRSIAAKIAQLDVLLSAISAFEEKYKVMSALSIPQGVSNTIRQQDILHFCSQFAPCEAEGFEKIRIGSESDGGYVFLNDFADVSAVVSCGISNDVTCDVCFAEIGKTVVQFDHTVDGPPIQHEKFQFHKQAIDALGLIPGSVKLWDVVSRIGDQPIPDLLLKMDIDGEEWATFANFPLDQLKRFRQISCEFHWSSRLRDPAYYSLCLRAIENIRSAFFPIYVHGNNFAGFSNLNGVVIPEVFEVTFANHDLYRPSAKRPVMLTELSHPNNPNAPELFLGSPFLINASLASRPENCAGDFAAEISRSKVARGESHHAPTSEMKVVPSTEIEERNLNIDRSVDLNESLPRVLIVAHSNTYLTELSLLGQLIRERSEAKVLFYCTFTHWTADHFAQKCAAEAVACLLDPLPSSLDAHFPKRSSSAASASSTVDGPGRRAFTLEGQTEVAEIAGALPGIGPAFTRERLEFERRALEITDLLKRTRPSLLVLGGDMAGYDSSLFIKVAHDAGLKVLVVPSTMSNGLEQAEVYYNDPHYHVTGGAGEVVGRLFPKWVRQHKGRRLFRCPPGRVLAMEFLGLAPPQPWIFNSGAADVIAMESEAMIDYYVAAGMTREKMELTGTLSDDVMANNMRMADEYRRQLCGELDLPVDRPIILTALPPDFLYLAGGRPTCDFTDYRKLVDFWIDTLASLSDCNRIIALHPSVDIESMRYVERAGIKIGRWRTANMVPTCDVYVASISSTIRWAIACGKPVVNYDVYRYQYTDFVGVPGVLTMEEQEEFSAALTRIARDADYRHSIAQAQKAAASKWGTLDGRVGERMLSLIGRLSGIKAHGGHGRRGEELPLDQTAMRS